MMFNRPGVRYGQTPELDTPYRRARQAWDDRIGAVAVSGRRAWRLALVQGLSIIALSGALVWQGVRGQVVPWVVEVDRFGEARVVAPASVDYRPTDPMIAARLGRFVEEVRSVSADPIVVRQNWLRAYDFTSPKGARVLSAYAQGADPFLRVGKEQVSIEVVTVLRASPSSFRLAWIERRYQDGALIGTERWSAIITLVERPTRRVDELKKNPLGVFVDAIDWSKEMG
jgi:type IV secretion system protein VirB5